MTIKLGNTLKGNYLTGIVRKKALSKMVELIIVACLIPCFVVKLRFPTDLPKKLLPPDQ